jgi:hypothetical protein
MQTINVDYKMQENVRNIFIHSNYQGKISKTIHLHKMYIADLSLPLLVLDFQCKTAKGLVNGHLKMYHILVHMKQCINLTIPDPGYQH